jgi:hypothetical protein
MVLQSPPEEVRKEKHLKHILSVAGVILVLWILLLLFQR